MTQLPARLNQAATPRQQAMLSCLTPLVALSPIAVLLFWIAATTASPWAAVGAGATLVVPGFLAARALAEPPRTRD